MTMREKENDDPVYSKSSLIATASSSDLEALMMAESMGGLFLRVKHSSNSNLSTMDCDSK